MNDLELSVNPHNESLKKLQQIEHYNNLNIIAKESQFKKDF